MIFILLLTVLVLCFDLAGSNLPRRTEQMVTASITSTARCSLAFLAVGLAQKPARSSTYFDTEVYGDKELKIAAVNKIKQKIRNAILEDTQLAPQFLKVAINDALGYDQATKNGGADGSILQELDLECNQGLNKAVSALKKVKQDLQRTVSVSFADICAFAGAEAMESVGCERVPIQLGRFDSKTPNRKANTVPWLTPTATELLAAFAGSGLDTTAAVILLGAVGETSRIVGEAKESNTEPTQPDDEFEQQPFVPITFGDRSAIYGVKVGNNDFGSEYFRKLLKEQLPLNAIGTTLLSNPTTKAIVSKYASSDGAFRSDLVKTYLKLTRLGEVYTTRNS